MYLFLGPGRSEGKGNRPWIKQGLDPYFNALDALHPFMGNPEIGLPRTRVVEAAWGVQAEPARRVEAGVEEGAARPLGIF